MKKSKLLALCIVLAIVGSVLATGALAASGSREETLHFRDIKITLDGNELVPKDVDGDTVEPFIISGTTYLPVRALSDALGLFVDWNDKESTVVLKRGGSEQIYDRTAKIKELYEKSGCYVWTTFDNGGSTVVVYMTTNEPPEVPEMYFDWFDRATGERELAYSGIMSTAILSRDGATLKVLTSGDRADSSYKEEQVLHTITRQEQNGASRLCHTEESYYAPQGVILTVGMEKHASLTGIYLGNDELAGWAVSLSFDEQAGYESEFHAWKPCVPRTEVVNKNGECVIKLFNTVLAEGISVPTGAANGIKEIKSVECDGSDTIITLTLEDGFTRCNVSTQTSVTDGSPCALVSLDRESVAEKYPAGW